MARFDKRVTVDGQESNRKRVDVTLGRSSYLKVVGKLSPQGSALHGVKVIAGVQERVEHYPLPCPAKVACGM